MAIKLEKLYRKFARECSLLEYAFGFTTTASVPADSVRNQLIREMCVIRLHDTWHRFCRELILLSAGGKPITANGVRLSRSPGVNSYQDVVPALLNTYKKRRTEPAWHSPGECIDAARRLNIPNYDAVEQGLSLYFDSLAPTTQLTALRNYFAHRNRNTSQRVIDIARGLFINPIPPAFELVATLQSGITLFALWVIRLKTMARLSIQ